MTKSSNRESMRTRSTDKTSPDSTMANLAKLRSDYDHLTDTVDTQIRGVHHRIDGVEKWMESISVSIKDLSDTFQRRFQISWPLIISIIVGLTAVLGVLHQVGTAPLRDSLQHEIFLRQELQREFKEHEDKGAHKGMEGKHNTFVGKTETRFKEIETQLGRVSDVLNLQLQKRDIVLRALWDKTHSPSGRPNFPMNDNYFPTVEDHENNKMNTQ